VCSIAPFLFKRLINQFRKVLNIVIFFFSFLVVTCTATERLKAQIPIDTTYTVASTYRKLVKQYPHIKPVSTVPSENVRQLTDVVYLALEDSPFGRRELRADVFMPKGAKKKLPAILLIHGGGWRSGNKSLNTPMAQALASRGFVVVSAEYRLSLEAKYPAAILDAKSALKWMKVHAKEPSQALRLVGNLHLSLARQAESKDLRTMVMA
jgi:acetyl esterase/lipase